jgi:hypothetical protein
MMGEQEVGKLMAAQRKNVVRKKRGRPAIGQDSLTTIRLSSELREKVDAWAARQIDKPGRSEAILRLVKFGLESTHRRESREFNDSVGAVGRHDSTLKIRLFYSSLGYHQHPTTLASANHLRRPNQAREDPMFRTLMIGVVSAADQARLAHNALVRTMATIKGRP